jgi:hypothetical protein
MGERARARSGEGRVGEYGLRPGIGAAGGVCARMSAFLCISQDEVGMDHACQRGETSDSRLVVVVLVMAQVGCEGFV